MTLLASFFLPSSSLTNMYVCIYMYLSVRSLSSEGVGRRESGHLGVDVERTMLPEREREREKEGYTEIEAMWMTTFIIVCQLGRGDKWIECPDYGRILISEGVVLCTDFNGGPEDVSLLERWAQTEVS